MLPDIVSDISQKWTKGFAKAGYSRIKLAVIVENEHIVGVVGIIVIVRLNPTHLVRGRRYLGR
jgi:hypothetical protein